ncbi:MAG TPA: NRDE family protein [Gammaproteobacteria bacterium]|nr:NRDE family protein [Gammaproteobacteria bacterium]
MCLIVVGVGASARYPLLVAANRDEQHARPTQAAAWWPDAPHVLGGRDLSAGGTWLAIDARGRFAAVTNIREPNRPVGLRSRGSLVADFLTGRESAARYAERAAADGAAFGAFNLLLFDGRELHFASNRSPAANLSTGLHAYSNAPPGTEWPKTASALAAAEPLVSHAAPIAPLFALLAMRDDEGPPESRYQRAHFVVGATYGTRCSTVVLIGTDGRLTFNERTFDAAGTLVGEVRESFALAR